MDIINLSKEEMKSVLERYELAMERIREIEREEEVRMPLGIIFKKYLHFLFYLMMWHRRLGGSYLKLSLRSFRL